MSDEFVQKSRAFMSWLTSVPGVAINPKIGLADYRERGAGRGVKALQDIEEDEDLFTIPRASVISVQNSDLPQKLPRIFQGDGSSQAPWTQLVLVLIYEFLRGEQSPWKAYFDILPTKENFNTLMFWSAEELSELQASAVLRKIGKEDADKMFSEQVVPQVRKEPDVFGADSLSDEELFALAHQMGTIIMAYAFDLEKDVLDTGSSDEEWDEEDAEAFFPKGLVPLADMLNADDNSNASLFYAPTSLTMKSLRSIPAGAEILNDYGQLPRADLLRRYGYTTPLYARHDCVEIERWWLDDILAKHQQTHFGRRLTEEESEERRDYLFSHHGDDYEDGFDIVWPESSENLDFFPDDLSRYIKTLVADPAEGSSTPWKKTAKTGLCDDFLLARFEAVMLEAVVRRREQYATSLEHDLELLEQPDTRGRLRSAIEVRLGEKKILAAAEERLRGSGNGAGEEPASKKRRVE